MRAFISLTVTITALLLLSKPFSLNAIDIEQTKESNCFEIKETAPIDLAWAATIKFYYYLLMSRYDLYNAGVELSEKQPQDLHEDELYYDSCITYSAVPGAFIGRGFGGNQKIFPTKHTKGIEIFEFSSGGNGGFGSGTCYNTLTDNKTFVVSACCCASNDQMSWAALSPDKSLPKDTVKKIYDHVESLGFKREYFTALRFDHCDFDKKTK